MNRPDVFLKLSKTVIPIHLMLHFVEILISLVKLYSHIKFY